MTSLLNMCAPRTTGMMVAGLLAASLTLSACNDFDSPDLNASTTADLTGTPNRVAIGTAAQGLLGSVTGTNVGVRNIFGTNRGIMGILGREAYNLDVSNPQNIPTFYTSVGGNSFKNLTTWTGPYATMNQANIIFKGADAATGVTPAEQEGLKGFAETIKALELFYVIRQTDVSGAALDALASPTDDPPPIESKAAVYTKILAYLDDAKTHLAAGGASFAFSMPNGWANFNTPAKFLQFNRAVRAWANITNLQFAAALTDLKDSFLDPAKAMSYGAYHTFSTLAGDAQNGAFDPTGRQLYASREFADSAQLKSPGGAKDDRFTTKLITLRDLTGGTTDSVTRYGFNVRYAFNIYPTNVSPAVVMKNEQLLLMRAEAYIGLGGAANNSLAIADINLVRAASGGLPPISDPYVPNAALKQPGVCGTQACAVAAIKSTALLEELLYEKRYSLMYENGDRWVDARKYGRIQDLERDRPGDVNWAYLMIPINECILRGTSAPPGCTTFPPFFTNPIAAY
jgi:hypothetical protein